MERRRFSPLDDYVVTLNESPELQNRRIQFYNDLRHFYRRRWGCPLKVPSIHGVDVDLFRLYEAVVAQGGWQKVSSGERWSEVVREICLLDEDVQMAEFGIRTLYMRYLSKFEQAEFGNDNDDHDSELLTTRGRLKSMAAVAAHVEAPVSMPRAGASDTEEPNYRKIVHSLLSGLPNEVDFALNVCTVISHPGPYLLRLADCPQILTVFAAHCGVFDDGTNALTDLHLDGWWPVTGRDFGAFWLGANITDTEVRALIAPILDSAVFPSSANEGQIVVDDCHFDLRNSTNWRVFQILSICRNLSFEECNRPTMAASVPLLKFLVVCCHTKYQIISNNAFETLSNIAGEIDLGAEGSVIEGFLLLKTIARALFSADKFEVLQALEILTGLCHNKNNEPILCEFLSECVVARIFALVTACDINTCLFTLESLYQISEMGRSACELIGQHNRAVDILVDLTTTDAASFGKIGLGGIKVVEINPVTGQTQPYQSNTGQYKTPKKRKTIKPPREQSIQSVHSVVAAGSISQKSFTTMVANGVANSIAPRPAIASLPRPLHPYQPLQQHQSYAPVPPSPLATGGPSTPRPLVTAAYPAQPPVGASPLSSGVTPSGTVPPNYQYTSSSVSTSVMLPTVTPEGQPQPLPTAVTDSITTPTVVATPKSSKIPAAAISVATTPSSTVRGRRFAAGIRQSALRKEKSAAKAASMRAVQEVVAAMSTSANHRRTDGEDGSAVVDGAPLTAETGESRLEHLTKMWIHAHCVLLDDAVANRGEMYAAYVEHIQGTKTAAAGGGTQMLAGGMQMFINQLKAIFPSIIITHSPGSTIHAVEGIRFCKEGIYNDLPEKRREETSEGGGLLIAACAARPLSASGNGAPVKAEEADSTNDKKALANGFLHDGSLERPLQNGDAAAAVKANGLLLLTDNKNQVDDGEAKNNNNNDRDLLSKAAATKKEDVGPSSENGAMTTNDSAKSVKTDKMVAEEPIKYLNADEEEDRTGESDKEKKANKLTEVDEDKVSSTIDSLLRSTAGTTTANGQTQQLPITSTGRGKRRTTNGHGRGFAKRAKPTADSPKPDGKQLVNGTVTAATVVVGQSVTMGGEATAASTSATPLPVARPIVMPELMCEWDCCGRLFTSANAMLFHNTVDHLDGASSSSSANLKFICRWPGCDSTARSKWSITTHLQDHHCADTTLQLALRKRLEIGVEHYLAWCRQRISKLPAAGATEGATTFSRISAMDAVRRHALVGVPNEITDDSEGPVTRSMRLTSCLVLRNIAKHSVEGRRRIRKYESHLCRLALSRMESNVVLAQALAELSAHSTAAAASGGNSEPADGEAPATAATPAV